MEKVEAKEPVEKRQKATALATTATVRILARLLCVVLVAVLWFIFVDVAISVGTHFAVMLVERGQLSTGLDATLFAVITTVSLLWIFTEFCRGAYRVLKWRILDSTKEERSARYKEWLFGSGEGEDDHGEED